MMKNQESLNWLNHVKLDPEDLAWDHAMDISGSVYTRMKELNLKKKDLAKLMGVKPSRISRILSGEQKITLSTLARLENALDMDMSEGFRKPKISMDSEYRQLVMEFSTQPKERSMSQDIDIQISKPISASMGE